MRIVFIMIAALLAAGVWAAPVPDTATYTLYRNSITDTTLRLHVATFDAAEGNAYNRENCAQAVQLFQGQPNVKTRFWCEPGRYVAALKGNESSLSKQFTTGKTEQQTCSLSAAELAKPVGGRASQACRREAAPG